MIAAEIAASGGTDVEGHADAFAAVVVAAAGDRAKVKSGPRYRDSISGLPSKPPEASTTAPARATRAPSASVTRRPTTLPSSAVTRDCAVVSNGSVTPSSLALAVSTLDHGEAASDRQEPRRRGRQERGRQEIEHDAHLAEPEQRRTGQFGELGDDHRVEHVSERISDDHVSGEPEASWRKVGST